MDNKCAFFREFSLDLSVRARMIASEVRSTSARKLTRFIEVILGRCGSARFELDAYWLVAGWPPLSVSVCLVKRRPGTTVKKARMPSGHLFCRWPPSSAPQREQRRCGGFQAMEDTSVMPIAKPFARWAGR